MGRGPISALPFISPLLPRDSLILVPLSEGSFCLTASLSTIKTSNLFWSQNEVPFVLNINWDSAFDQPKLQENSKWQVYTWLSPFCVFPPPGYLQFPSSGRVTLPEPKVTEGASFPTVQGRSLYHLKSIPAREAPNMHPAHFKTRMLRPFKQWILAS